MDREELLEKVRSLPAHPGVYIMKDANGKVIYVGKSKCLKNRVPHYFQPISSLDVKTARLSEKIYDFECLYTDNETEALILENELIKKYKPKYNIKLKDAKTYPYIKITKEDYPRILFTRTRKNDKAKYYGPYTSSFIANDIIKTVQKIFKISSCTKQFAYGTANGRPCLNYHINQCIAPCSGNISPEEYKAVFAEIEDFLKGDYTESIEDFRAKMQEASEQMRFEAAAQYRDRIIALERLSQNQKIVTSNEKEQDVFGLYESESLCAISVLFIRAGKLIDKENIVFSPDEVISTETLFDFVQRYYRDGKQIPKNILLSFELPYENIRSLEEMLSAAASRSVSVTVPQRGTKRELANMATDNTMEAVRAAHIGANKSTSTLVRLCELLDLEALPVRIEAFDISNNLADDTYAGMVVFEDGKPKKSDYRCFKIKTDGAPDDYASMREAVKRRMEYLIQSKQEDSFSQIPDIIFVDGGKGHVNAVKDIVQGADLGIAVFGMVKDKFHKTRTITDGENEIGIATEQSVFSFIYTIQEEVHRFTISKMDASRRKSVKTTSLESINGIGKAKAKLLLSHFKSLNNLKNATVEELCRVKGINIPLATAIYEYYHKTEDKNI